MEYSNLFVTAMGIGTVFFALASLVILTKIMSALIGKQAPVAPVAPPASVAAAPAPVVAAAPAAAPVQKDPAMMAAISAALAEELGTDVAALRIHSIKRI